MKHSLWLLLGLGLAVTAPQAAEVRLELSGTSYNGGPAFDLAFGNTVVGEGVVDPAAGTNEGVFRFEVSDLLLVSNPDLRIRLTNDARGGPGEDRNLYIVSAAVNGVGLPIADFAVLSKGEARPHRLRNGHLEVWSGNEVAVASPPTSGWPLGQPALRPAFAALDVAQGQ
jgi:hypothetical protein